MPKQKIDPTIANLFRTHRKRVNRLVENGSVRPLRKMYEAAILRSQRSLERQIKIGRGDSYTAQHHRMVLAQLRVGVSEIARNLGQQVALKAHEAQVESMRNLIGNIKTADQIATGIPPTLAIEEAAVFYGVLQNADPSLARAYPQTMQNYGIQMMTRIEGELGLMLATGGSTYDAVSTVTSIMGQERWKADRIVRTEVMHAYNAAHRAGLVESARQLPMLFGRWTENVSDTGRPYDNRVANDSMALHGQIARPTGVFTMPPAVKVKSTLWGQQYAQPPNRPNDRARLEPWRPEWGIPAYLYQGGRRIPLTGDETEAEVRALIGSPLTEAQKAEAATLQASAGGGVM